MEWTAAATRPAWTTVECPYPAFELLMPELAGTDYSYAIQRRGGDGARKDLGRRRSCRALCHGQPLPRCHQRDRRAHHRFTTLSTTSSRRARSTANSAILPPQSEGESQLRWHERRCLRPAVRRARVADRRLVLQRGARGGGLGDGRLHARLAEAGDRRFGARQIFAPHRGQAHLLRPAQPDTRSDAGARDEIAPARATKLKAALCVRVPAR